MVILKDIDMSNFNEVIKLKLSESDQEMVATNTYSLAEAYADKISEPKAIYANNILVGFVMYDYDINKKTGFISRLMITSKYQRNGYARKALEIVLDDLRIKPNIEKIKIAYNPQNLKAKPLYLSVGFIETSDYLDEEIVAVINL